MPVSIRGSGQVPVQVIQTVKTDTFTTTSTSFVDVTGLSATITPTSSSNRILIIAQISYSGGNGNSSHFRISGGNSTNYVGNSAGSRTRGVFGGYWISNLTSTMPSGSIVYLDSPATTSAVTYVVQTCKGSTGGNPSQVNLTIDDSDNNNIVRAASSIIVMEISG
jgi:uncharacterized Ntn-hydrolase superfamily protein